MDSLRKDEEKDAYTYFDRLCWKLKRALDRTPLIGQLRLTSFVAALWLLKENLSEKMSDTNILEDEFIEFLKVNYSSYPVTKKLVENKVFEKSSLKPGRYGIRDTNVIFTVNEEIFPCGSCLNHKVYRIGNHILTQEHLMSLNEDGEGGGGAIVGGTPSCTVGGVMPYTQGKDPQIGVRINTNRRKKKRSSTTMEILLRKKPNAG